MGQPSSPCYDNALDLLRRFVPTPSRARFCSGKLWVTVETNDFSLFPPFPFDGNSHRNPQDSFHWKLVRDFDITSPLEEPIFFDSDSMRAALMGPSCLLGVDMERRQLVGFIGASVDAHCYREFLVPLLLRLSTGTLCGDALANFTEFTGRVANV